MQETITKIRKRTHGYGGDLERLSGPFGVDESCFPPLLGGPPTSRLNFSANDKTCFSKFSNRTLPSIDRWPYSNAWEAPSPWFVAFCLDLRSCSFLSSSLRGGMTRSYSRCS